MLLLGLGSVAAYRPVGIARKTGYRWHAARGGLPLLRLREDEHGTRYLSLLERRIATLRGQGLTERGVARRLGRAASTVRRARLRRLRRGPGACPLPGEGQADATGTVSHRR